MTTEKVFTYEAIANELDMDTLGHMNHASYLKYFELARWQLGTETGYGFKEVQEHQSCPIPLELTIRFHREVLLREVMKIETRFLSYRHKLLKLEQRMLKPNGKRSATIDITYAVLNLKDRTILPAPAEWLEKLGLSAPGTSV